MSEKKFANTHYPGIKADPNEGSQQIDPRAKEKLKKLFDALGEQEVSKRQKMSVLLNNYPNPESLQDVISAVRNLVELGIGRIGLLGETNSDGISLLQTIKAWISQESPWVVFEPFAELALDRQMDDITRGFDLLFEISQAQTAPEISVAIEKFVCENS